MARDAYEELDGGVVRDRYGRRVLVAVEKHRAPAVTDLPQGGGYTDADGREQVVLISGNTGANLLTAGSGSAPTLVDAGGDSGNAKTLATGGNPDVVFRNLTLAPSSGSSVALTLSGLTAGVPQHIAIVGIQHGSTPATTVTVDDGSGPVQVPVSAAAGAPFLIACLWDGTDLTADAVGVGPGDASSGVKGLVQLAGDLTGSADSPQIASGAVGAAEIAAALKPSGSAVAADESLRRLGTGSTHAAAGDDARFPTTGQKNALAGTSGTPGTGNEYVTTGDARMTNARTPTAHTHGVADIGTGTPGAGKYVDGATGAWTALPAGGSGGAPPFDSLVPPVVANVIGPTGTATLAADTLRGGRYTIRKTGLLKGFLVPVSTATGNIIIAAYDTGQASATVRTKLGDTGSVACPAAGWAYVPLTADIAVTAGQHIDAATMTSAGPQFGRIQLGAAGLEIFPTGLPGTPLGSAVIPKLAWTMSQTFGSGAPATVAEASAATITILPLIVLVVV